MPLLTDRSSAFQVVANLLMEAPVETLKLQGLLYHDTFDEVRVDQLEGPTAVLLRSGRFHAFFALDERQGRALLGELDWSAPQAFSGLHEIYVDWVADRAPITWTNPCDQYHLPDTGTVMEDLFAARGDDAHILEPSPEHVDLILEHWPYGDVDNGADRRHIEERIASGITTGWVEDHRLVAWAMTHQDGSMGYLHTLAGYRGQGIGGKILADLALKVWNLGLTPFGHVVSDNRAPTPLLGLLGFERHPDRFVWLGTAPA